MDCCQKGVFWIVIAIVVNLVEFAHAQNDDLPDAPKQIRFYANQLKSSFEKIKTLRGEIRRLFRRSVNTAVFHHDRGNQLGIEDISVAGDFIREDSEVYTFTWDLASNNLVSIGVPSDKPYRYLDAKTNKELVPEHKNSVIGEELKTVINSQYAISTSFEKRTADGQSQIYERTQNNVHGMKGSPKEVFYWAPDLTYHEFLFGVAKQLQEEGDSAGVCHLSIENDLHTLDLIANSKTGDPLTYKWVFDASRAFVLKTYECRIGKLNNVTTHEWTYSVWDSVGFVPTRLTTTIVDNDGRRQHVFELSKLVVNEEVGDDIFSLASLGPSNGDVLVDNESGETFFIRDDGKDLVSTDPTKQSRSGVTFLVLILVNVAFAVIVIGLFIRRRLVGRRKNS